MFIQAVFGQKSLLKFRVCFGGFEDIKRTGHFELTYGVHSFDYLIEFDFDMLPC